MFHSNKFSGDARIPIIPLPIELEHIKVTGEIIVDESARKIFIVDRNDRNVKHDLTDWIITNIDGGNLSGDNIQINLEGFGIISLKNIFKEIIERIDSNTISAKEIDDFAFYFKDGGINLNVISPYNNDLEIKGFTKANNNTIPVKISNTIMWLDLNKITSNNGGIIQGNPQIDGSTNGNSNIDGNNSNNQNTIDNKYGDVFDIEPNNGVIYLLSSERQMSKISGTISVILPKLIFDYGQIKWFIHTKDTILTLLFKNTIDFNIDNYNKFKPNKKYVLSFVTYDKGITWLCDIQEYGYQHRIGR